MKSNVASLMMSFSSHQSIHFLSLAAKVILRFCHFSHFVHLLIYLFAYLLQEQGDAGGMEKSETTEIPSLE